MNELRCQIITLNSPDGADNGPARSGSRHGAKKWPLRCATHRSTCMPQVPGHAKGCCFGQTAVSTDLPGVPAPPFNPHSVC